MNETQQAILGALQKHARPMSVVELITLSGKSRVSVQKELKKLTASGDLTRLGTPPRVYYVLNTPTVSSTQTTEITLPADQSAYINEHFDYIDPTGHEFPGIAGFQMWCQARGMNVIQKAPEFVAEHRKYQNLIKDGLIDATHKIATTFGPYQHLSHLYFLYPYSIPVFGKTKLASWLFVAKQTQDMHLLNRVLDIVVPQIQAVIRDRDYEAIAFVPPTVPRETQIMDLLYHRLSGSARVIPVLKTPRPIRVQQKSLKELSDRVKNAEATLMVPIEGLNLSKVLIIDDFTGSGSTLNVLAGVFQQQHIATTVDGLTITGSMNGFDVVKEI